MGLQVNSASLVIIFCCISVSYTLTSSGLCPASPGQVTGASFPTARAVQAPIPNLVPAPTGTAVLLALPEMAIGTERGGSAAAFSLLAGGISQFLRVWAGLTENELFFFMQ